MINSFSILIMFRDCDINSKGMEVVMNTSIYNICNMGGVKCCKLWLDLALLTLTFAIGCKQFIYKINRHSFFLYSSSLY